MSRIWYENGYTHKPIRAREVVKPVLILSIAHKHYLDPKQASITLGWMIANNLDIKIGGMQPYKAGTGWSLAKRKAVYKRAQRRVLPICKRLLKCE